ncbi:MAG TPA: hypothetical protein VHP34_11385 [Alphaproteobacteria bacterium]|nr:hypothetical protein [Alphaproteobacteria bacterium]
MTDTALKRALELIASGERMHISDARRIAKEALSAHSHPVETVKADVQPVAWGEPNPNEALEAAIEIDNFISGELRQTYWWEQKGTAMAKAILGYEASIAETRRRISDLEIIRDSHSRDTLEALRERDKANTALAECQREKEELRELTTHIQAWRRAILFARNYAEVKIPDIDDRAYWQHELVALDKLASLLNSEGA